MKSRNQREGLYCGTFRANGNPPKKTYRQPYGEGAFITLKEYGKLRKLDAVEFQEFQKEQNAKP